jgi:hypothetical protein
LAACKFSYALVERPPGYKTDKNFNPAPVSPASSVYII